MLAKDVWQFRTQYTSRKSRPQRISSRRHRHPFPQEQVSV